MGGGRGAREGGGRGRGEGWAGGGAFVTDPTAPLMTVTGTQQVWAVAAVPENLTDAVHVGQTVDITYPALPGRTTPVSYTNLTLPTTYPV